MTPFLWAIALLFVFLLGLIIGGWIEHKIMVIKIEAADVYGDGGGHPVVPSEDYCNHQWVQQRPGSVDMECKHCGVKV